MGMEASGSPLAARQSALPYTVLLMFFAVIGVAFVIWLGLQVIKMRKRSPAYIEAQKKRPTNQNDIKELGKKLNLTKQEMILLWKVVKGSQAPNILHSYTDIPLVDSLFKAAYAKSISSNEKQEVLYEIFRLRFHIEKAVMQSKIITSSTSIPLGHTLSFQAKNGINCSLEIISSDKDSILLSLPRSVTDTSNLPPPLSKITLTYLPESQIQYVLSSRVVRYQSSPKDGSQQMIITHSNTITMQNRRQFKRVASNQKCLFGAVEEKVNSKNEKSYIPKDIKYEAKVADISGGGVKLLTKLPIKDKQKLYMKIPLSNGKVVESMGVIVGMHREPGTDLYALHISFFKIPLNTRNLILADVYKYGEFGISES